MPSRQRQNANARSRRRFLTCSSSSLTLPWLSSLPIRAEESGKTIPQEKLADNGPPRRFGCIFFSNGVEPEHWWARQEGSKIDLGPSMAPLRQHTDQCTIVKGLYNEQAASHPSPHMGRMANLLSGAWVSRDQAEIRVGRTMDQVMATVLGEATPIPSLALGIEPTELRLEDGLSMLYGSSISWTSDTQPAPKEIYPARVFDQIVGRADNRELDQSILDELTSEIAGIRVGLSQEDRRKLDEYTESIRGIERRLEKSSSESRLEGWRPSATEPTFARPSDDLPQDVAEHMRLMLDMIILAFQMDQTRIATCMLNNDLSQMNFGFLDGVQGSLHLDLTHNGRDPELEAMYLATNQFHYQQLSYLIERMSRIDEGGTSLLDNSMLMFCSNLFDGDRHQADEMPIVLAGGGGGTLKHGRVIDVSNQPAEDKRACSLYLSLMDRMGVSLPRFGDSQQRFKLLDA